MKKRPEPKTFKLSPTHTDTLVQQTIALAWGAKTEIRPRETLLALIDMLANYDDTQRNTLLAQIQRNRKKIPHRQKTPSPYLY